MTTMLEANSRVLQVPVLRLVMYNIFVNDKQRWVN